MKRTGAAAGFANVRTVPAAEDDPLLPEPVDLDSVEDNFFVIYSCASCGSGGSDARIEGPSVIHEACASTGPPCGVHLELG